VEWIDRILRDPSNEGAIDQVRKEINAYMGRFPLY
jgi:hypothetical protein